jgi:hypothetical protein
MDMYIPMICCHLSNAHGVVHVIHFLEEGHHFTLGLVMYGGGWRSLNVLVVANVIIGIFDESTWMEFVCLASYAGAACINGEQEGGG